MSILFQCPGCQTRIKAPDDGAGTMARCPHCTATVAVPQSAPASDFEDRASRERVHDEDDELPRRSRRRVDVDDYEDDDYDRPARRRRRYYDEDDRSRRRGFECRYCGSDEPPGYRNEISPAGWIVFGVFLFFCPLLCWVGLLITESNRVCRDCGRRLS